MNAITPNTAARLSILADLDGGNAEFTPEQTTLSFGKGAVIVPRAVWPQIIEASTIYDGVLFGRPAVVEVSTPTAPAAPRTFPDLGAAIGGGFCVGRHPVVEGAVLITAGISGEAKKSWAAANDHCRSYGADGMPWKAPDRLEKLLIWKLLGAPHTTVEAFKNGGEHAFAEEWYWTEEESQFASDYAWGQTFGSGRSGTWGKVSQLRVRPVRIHFI